MSVGIKIDPYDNCHGMDGINVDLLYGAILGR